MWTTPPLLATEHTENTEVLVAINNTFYGGVWAR